MSSSCQKTMKKFIIFQTLLLRWKEREQVNAKGDGKMDFMKMNDFILVRLYQMEDFPAIDRLNAAAGWTNLVEKKEDTKAAWGNSNVAFVAEVDGRIVGCLRGLTDGVITLYIAELLIDEELRGKGIGKELLAYVHALYPKTRIELLASSTSRTYYESQRYRPFYGFRKTIQE